MKRRYRFDIEFELEADRQARMPVMLRNIRTYLSHKLLKLAGMQEINFTLIAQTVHDLGVVTGTDPPTIWVVRSSRTQTTNAEGSLGAQYETGGIVRRTHGGKTRVDPAEETDIEDVLREIARKEEDSLPQRKIRFKKNEPRKEDE